jgi:tripartite-type tricarboxylate transporter receptor subunit TctC
MMNNRSVALSLSVAVLLTAGNTVRSQEYPNRLIRIVTGGAGGGNDVAARLVAQGLTASLGQQVIVENRPSGVIPGETVAKAPADGYMFLLAGSGFWIGHLLQSVPYDPVRDFSPVTLATSAPAVLVVHPFLRVKSVKDLIALAKARPGELNYSRDSVGSSPHLAAELFKSMAHVKIVGISYRSAPMQLADLLAGQTHMMFGSLGSIGAQVKVGRLRALAVTTAKPSALLPGVPAIAASGVPGYEWMQALAIFASARTPEPIIQRMNQEIVRVLNRPEMKDRFLNAGLEPVGTSSEQLRTMIQSEMAKIGKVIKEAAIKVE